MSYAPRANFYREIGGAGGPSVGGGGGAEAAMAGDPGADAAVDGDFGAAASVDVPPETIAGADTGAGAEAAGSAGATASRRATGLSAVAASFGGSVFATSGLGGSGLAGSNFASLAGLFSVSGLAPTLPLASLLSAFGFSSAAGPAFVGVLAIDGSSGVGLSLARCFGESLRPSGPSTGVAAGALAT